MSSVPEMARRVAEIAMRLQRRSRQEDRVHGITGARLAVLHRLVTKGSLQLTELARAEAVSPATMARIVDALEEGKLVLRVKSTPDGRAVRIVATTLGATLATSARNRRLRWLESFIGGLDDGERSTVEQALEILARAADWEAS